MNFISTFDELNKLYEANLHKNARDEKVTVPGDPTNEAIALAPIAAAALKAGAVAGAASLATKVGAKLGDKLTEDDDVVDTIDDEAAEDVEIEIVNDDDIPSEEATKEATAEEEEPKQVILECSKCGALVLKDEADLVTDEESDLVNVEDECQFCEETKGFKIVGVVAPYERELV